MKNDATEKFNKREFLVLTKEWEKLQKNSTKMRFRHEVLKFNLKKKSAQ
jgi:hypothetical protein